jgi:hypothetical protein
VADTYRRKTIPSTSKSDKVDQNDEQVFVSGHPPCHSSFDGCQMKLLNAMPVKHGYGLTPIEVATQEFFPIPHNVYKNYSSHSRSRQLKVISLRVLFLLSFQFANWDVRATRSKLPREFKIVSSKPPPSLITRLAVRTCFLTSPHKPYLGYVLHSSCRRWHVHRQTTISTSHKFTKSPFNRKLYSQPNMITQVIRFKLLPLYVLSSPAFSIIRHRIAALGAVSQYYGYSIPSQTPNLSFPKGRHEVTWVIRLSPETK